MIFRRLFAAALCTLGLAMFAHPMAQSQECVVCPQGTSAGALSGYGGFPASPFSAQGGAPAGYIGLPQGTGSCTGGSAGYPGGQSIGAPTVSEDSTIAIGYPSLPPGFGAGQQVQDVQVQWGGGFYRPRVAPRFGGFALPAQFDSGLYGGGLPLGWEVIRRPRLVVYYYRGY